MTADAEMEKNNSIIEGSGERIALYEKRIAAKNAATAAHNKATKQGGFGSVGRNAEIEYFSPDEVRAMSRSEVRENYNKILRSMSNWH